MYMDAFVYVWIILWCAIECMSVYVKKMYIYVLICYGLGYWIVNDGIKYIFWSFRSCFSVIKIALRIYNVSCERLSVDRFRCFRMFYNVIILYNLIVKKVINVVNIFYFKRFLQ